MNCRDRNYSRVSVGSKHSMHEKPYSDLRQAFKPFPCPEDLVGRHWQSFSAITYAVTTLKSLYDVIGRDSP